MSDLGDRAVDAPANTKTIEQTNALRGWLTALLAQTVQAETTIKYRIADLETEAGRLRPTWSKRLPPSIRSGDRSTQWMRRSGVGSESFMLQLGSITDRSARRSRPKGESRAPSARRACSRMIAGGGPIDKASDTRGRIQELQ